MMKVAVSALFLASSAAAATFRANRDIPADSKAANKLLSKATRELEGEQEFDWVSGYSIKYTGCSSLMQVAGREGGGGEDESQLYTQNLVKFSLCPSDYCSSGSNTQCPNGARYVVDMATFVEVYNEFQMDAQEWACEQLRENQCAYCENANDDEVCENQCYMDYEMEYCIEVEGEEQFEVERYLECQEAEENQNQNNNNNNYNYYNGWRQLYLGMYCSDNQVLLGAFLDMGCSTLAESGTYENQNYGNSLPYSTESLVQSDCISCKEVDRDNDNNNNNNNNGNDDQQDEDRVIELCEQVYQESGKCESDLPDNMVYYKDEGACDFLDNVLPQLEAASAKVTSRNSGSGGSAKFFAVVFAITTLALIGYVAFMHSQQSRKVDLSSKDAVEEQRREFT